MKTSYKYIKRLGILFLSLFVLAACSKEDDNNNGTDGSSDAEITAFTFLATDHEGLSEDVKATIDKGTKTIKAELPSNVDIKMLKPTITVSEGASASPKDKAATNFSEAVSYTVTAEDGSEAKYTVTVTVSKSSEKAIVSFKFLASENSSLSEDFTAMIDEDAKTVTGELPSVANLTKLTPSIVLSLGAAVSPRNGVTGFNKVVGYVVTATDGSKTEYLVDLKRALTDREALVSIYEANPNNTIGWDIASEDISQWGGVLVEDGLVVGLDLFQANLDTLPRAIGYLTNLKSLDLSFSFFGELPEELGNLQQLEQLYLEDAVLDSFPMEIIDLTNLEVLQANSIGWTSIPPEIAKLTKLKVLLLNANSLTSLPEEMGNLINLEALDLTDNQITIIPKAICELGIENFRKDDTAVCEQ